MRLRPLPLIFSAALAACAPRFQQVVQADRFYRGNVHVHSSESDGDAPPETVAAWYREHGYAFLSLTDHDKLTPASRVEGPGLVALPGVEVTARAIYTGRRVPIHVNALCASAALAGPKRVGTPADVLSETIGLARADGGVVLVNHPNFGWALGGDDLLAAPAFDLLEIASAHPLVRDAGDAEHPSAESMWDRLLDAGRPVRAVAVDDAHDFAAVGEDRRPGGAWIEAWAAEASTAAFCAALREGRFYASRGARLERLSVSGRALELAVADWDPATDRVEFVGPGGAVLASTRVMPARYVLRRGVRRVRARVRQSGGREAWTQSFGTR